MVTRRPSANDLLVLLEVARTGRYVRAASALGLNHVTVSRRIAALERDLGGKVLAPTLDGWDLTPLGDRALRAAEQLEGAISELTSSGITEDVVRISAPEAFSAMIVAPAAAQLRQRLPQVSVEIVASTRPAFRYRSGIDIEIVIGKPDGSIADGKLLGGYTLGLYASEQYLQDHSAPSNSAQLRDHPFIYFTPSMIQVHELDVRDSLPRMPLAVTSTSVLAHVEATCAGGGIGLLPTFLAAHRTELIRILEDQFELSMGYWLVDRGSPTQRSAIAELTTEIKNRMTRLDHLWST